jgi:hypothetical protein
MCTRFARPARTACGLVLLSASIAAGQVWRADFTAKALTGWRPYLGRDAWSAGDGVLRHESQAENAALLAPVPPAADAALEADVRIAGSGRAKFGFVLRAAADGTCYVVRFHDWISGLELLRYEKGYPQGLIAKSGRLAFRPSAWHRLKAAIIGHEVRAKYWTLGGDEPDWQLQASVPDEMPGCFGVITMDRIVFEARDFQLRTGDAIAGIRDEWARERTERNARLREALRMAVELTPFVHRTEDGPRRRIDVRFSADGKPQHVAGELAVSFGEYHQTHTVAASDFVDDAYRLLVPEPAAPTELRITFTAAVGTTRDKRLKVAPVRPWTFYMTEHTHYDIGFTDPQPIVIERLADDMAAVLPFADATNDWPEGSRFKWTVEVSGLLENFVERSTPEQLAAMMDLVRRGDVEICGYYLNLATELVGHEELIRGLYYSQRVREKYNVPIDTVMIDDVPGYTWALASVLRAAGMPRASFRANGIRGKFLWDAVGAVARPFYWEGPDGSRLFVWYTDSYREGNFWRNPGLQEDRFIEVIRRNEAAGAISNLIQLRMGGDNLPPDLDVCENARAWNETYVWPRVRVATNREFLEALEAECGDRAPVVRGDIPSWWAEGPGSSAKETAINRGVHDQLAGAESLWTLLTLVEPGAEYPHAAIEHAYRSTMHFDEHTWGASESITAPKSETTLAQWRFKADYAYRAKSITDSLEADVLGRLAKHIPAPDARCVAVFNTLAWARSDVVSLPLEETPFLGAPRLEVTDLRSGASVPVQVTAYRSQAVFVARDVPPFGYAVFRIARTEAEAPKPVPLPDRTLENDWYRVVAAPDYTGLVRWDDKQRDRELIDADAPYRLNQAIYETPIGGRDAINRKKPVQFNRTAAETAMPLEHTAGPVFEQLVTRTSLPTCPRIWQTVRLYNELPVIDIINVVDKEEVLDPEGLYFAFPFAVPEPTFHLQIADAAMRAGIDQLPLSCRDYYAIQQWADVAGPDGGVVFAPVDAPLVVLSDMNVYQWADTLTFDKAHLYSLALNNYWFTNFKASQSGRLTFRYRLAAHKGAHDPIEATHTAWQPYHPLRPIWLEPGGERGSAIPNPWLRLDGDPVIVTCVKRAEIGDAVAVRLLEMRGHEANVTLRFSLPDGVRIAGAARADVLERPVSDLPVSDGRVRLTLAPHEIATLRLDVAAR